MNLSIQTTSTTAETQRVLAAGVIQGDDDLMIPPKVSHLMAGLIPDAQIRICPDAAHGFLFQYPAGVAVDTNGFRANGDGMARS